MEHRIETVLAHRALPFMEGTAYLCRLYVLTYFELNRVVGFDATCGIDDKLLGLVFDYDTKKFIGLVENFNGDVVFENREEVETACTDYLTNEKLLSVVSVNEESWNLASKKVPSLVFVSPIEAHKYVSDQLLKTVGSLSFVVSIKTQGNLGRVKIFNFIPGYSISLARLM